MCVCVSAGECVRGVCVCARGACVRVSECVLRCVRVSEWVWCVCVCVCVCVWWWCE